MSIPSYADRETHVDYKDYEFYVGDPCYVIADRRWSEFCDKLFKLDGYKKHKDYYGTLKWEVNGRTYDIECHASPGGDNTWDFHLNDDSGTKVSLPVDAGMLAIVPMECVCPEQMSGYGSITSLGAVFNTEPCLETTNHSCGWVELNGVRDRQYTDNLCDECENHDFNLEYCEHYGADVCWGCWQEEESEEE
jgi:hypothetical protein